MKPHAKFSTPRPYILGQEDIPSFNDVNLLKTCNPREGQILTKLQAIGKPKPYGFRHEDCLIYLIYFSFIATFLRRFCKGLISKKKNAKFGIHGPSGLGQDYFKKISFLDPVHGQF